VGIATAKAAQDRKAPSRSMSRTYWRMGLDRCLREPKLFRAIEVDGTRLRFVTSSWSKYWGYIPRRCSDSMRGLRVAWEAYVRAGCEPSRAAPYSCAYFAVLRALLGHSSRRSRSCSRFLAKVLGFENFLLRARGGIRPFALATASFRNPVFLSFAHHGLRKHDRSDPGLLALAVGCWEDGADLFYHYRKQRLLKNTDDSILFFPAADLAHRPASFCGLEALTDVLVAEWDSRVKERSQLLAEKVLAPVLGELPQTATKQGQTPMRILDIGSGVGLLTSRVLGRLAKSGVLGPRKLELCLLDLFPVDPRKHFAGDSLMRKLGKVDYVSGDCMRDLDGDSSLKLGRFDVAFLFRILHNMSLFRVGHAGDRQTAEAASGRYPFTPHLSEYYAAISRLFPHVSPPDGSRSGAAKLFFPVREFNPSALLTVGGASIIERLLRISKGILIEDADLKQDILVEHIRDHVRSPASIYDFSRALRLSVNHVYWITAAPCTPPAGGEMIWPK